MRTGFVKPKDDGLTMTSRSLSNQCQFNKCRAAFFPAVRAGKKIQNRNERLLGPQSTEISCPLKQPEVKACVGRGSCTWVSSAFRRPLRGGCRASPFCPRAHLCHLTAAPSPTTVHFPSALGSKCPPESMPTWYLRTTPLGRGLHRQLLWGRAGPHAVSGVLGRGSPDTEKAL